jgi:dTDP-4-dehydrorhamnose 3,5-epimerase
MNEESLDNILLTPLKRITMVAGDVMHALNSSDNGYNGFGEVYFSWVKQGAIKAWKKHLHMTLNLVVPVGEVNFVFHLKNQRNVFRSEIIGKERYLRLTVPPGIWFGFQGISDYPSLIMSLIDIPHDPTEVLRKKLSEIDYNWSSE